MIKIEELEKGQEVWECESGHNVLLRVTSSPVDDGAGWRCDVVTKDGSKGELFRAHGSHPYGPRLYDRKQYLDNFGDWRLPEDWD